MVRQIFKGRVIAAAGPLPGQLTPQNLRHWTGIRKGRFSEEMDDSVTHLLCTREQYNKRVDKVKAALKRERRPYIVHCDWFELSAVDEKKLPEREYSMSNFQAEQRAKQRELQRIEKGRRDGERFVNTNLFHLYQDREHFVYQIDITRDDETTGEIGQRYSLCLWESNARPHLYWFTAKFLKKKGDGQPSYYRPSPCSGKWQHEMDQFMDFFQKKTGIDWEDRVVKERTTPATMFQYTYPRGGKPVGRRLRHSYEYCLEVNAGLRGLPWPPVDEVASTEPGDLVGLDNILPKPAGSLDGEQGSSGGDHIGPFSETGRDNGDNIEGADSSTESCIRHSTTQAPQHGVEVSSGMKDAIEAHDHMHIEPATTPCLAPDALVADESQQQTYDENPLSPSQTDTTHTVQGQAQEPRGTTEPLLSQPQQASDSLYERIDVEGIGNAVQRALRFPAIAAPSA